MNTVSAKQKEPGKKDEVKEIPNAFARAPQAKDDLFTMGQIETDETITITENTGNTFVLDVMANDKGDRGRELWSLDDGTSEGGDAPKDLLNQTGSSEVISAMGARISITPDGKVAYTFTPELQAELQSLSEGQFATDTFTYAIRFGNGTLSWATATVKIAGVNDAPVLTGTSTELAAGTEGMSYQIKVSDLLAGYTDVEGDSLSVANLTATHGTLAETDEGWLFTPDAGFNGVIELNYDVTDGHGGSTAATQSFMLAPLLLDTAAPLFNSSYPGDDSTGFQIDGDIQLNFNEVVKAGSGNIVISNGSDTRTIDVTDTNQVTFSSSKYGNFVTIDPTDNLASDTTYSIQMDTGVIEDMAGNDFAGITDPAVLNFTTVSSDPLLNWSNPWDESMDFQADGNIELYFNEMVKAGSGDIVISNGSDTRMISVNDASQVTFNGYGGVIINPTADLISGTTYSIQMAAGVIEDVAGNDYAGISDSTTLNFTTISSDPLLNWSNPWDGFAEFQIDGNIELNFNEAVRAGSGDIVISNGSDTRTISVNDVSQVSFNSSKYGNSVTINPIADLIPNTTYNIQMAAGVIEDMAGNDYAGISDPTTLNFTTISSDPLLNWSNPWDETTFKIDGDIQLYFNEAVRAGSGNIVISNGSDTRTISVTDASQVTFDGYGSVIINPTADLILGSDYNIQIASGAIEDMNGYTYAGIADPTTLNFTTISSDPLLTWSNPWDESTLKLGSDIILSFDEMVKAGNGDIVISNGSDTRMISVNDASQVSFNGSKVIINPATDLIPDTTYNIQMAAGVIEDMSGNDYAGINDPTALNFVVLDSDPLLISITPWDDATDFWVGNDIQLYFDEVVQAGNGDIVISNGTDTRMISINDASQITFNGSKYGSSNSITINPTMDLLPNTSYNIQLAEGVIVDMEGNAYAGINDATTLNFMTTDIIADPFVTTMGVASSVV